MSSGLADAKRQAAIANRVLADVGLAGGITATLGHASVRIPDDPGKFVIKGRGYAIDALAAMTPDDMVLCDLEGYQVDAAEGLTQCFEVKLHSCIYRARPEIQGIVHVHPRYTVLMSVLKQTLVPMCVEGSELVRTPLPVYPHAWLIASDEDGMGVVEVMGTRPAAILFGHGAVTASTSVDLAVTNMIALEEQARMNYLAYAAAGPDHPFIPEQVLVERGAQQALTTLPHFADSMRGKQPEVRGVWTYYADRAAKSLDG
jgi:ribulose-5-phosphate 4-epimerase/fuculose-1-phosphate aldolase